MGVIEPGNYNFNFTNIQRLTTEEFQKFAKLIYQESGIFLKEAKITLLSNRLRKRLQTLNLTSFIDYYHYLEKLPDKSLERSKEIEQLIDVVSTNETYFFRNERHFDALMEHCLPEVIKAKGSNHHLRIWSAGCSTGEEPYTLAICVLEKMNLLQNWKVEIMATDIAPSVLEFAKKGRYSGRRIEKVPAPLLKKYFNQDPVEPEYYIVKDEVKKLVNFSYINLFKSPYPENIDILFCRNVMIYFDREYQRTLVGGFYKVINSYGFLFIGHSETLHSISEDFVYQKILDAPVYVPKGK